MDKATRATSKMSVHDLRALAQANGITKGLHGTSKQSLVRMIDKAQGRYTTHLTEMAEFFPVTMQAQPQPTTIQLVPARFWQPGDTHEQALARQQASLQKLQAKIAGAAA